ncbi:hypothetical protein AB0I66_41535 [Streptomyces sp. NPDC050439]|uniref:hypothetical protein n=1 Tax=unclassified Streptomyces TaxID=2593676 RepID=UPI00341827D7
MHKHTIIQHLTRLLGPPRDTRRQPPAFARQLAGLWLFALALGAGLTALALDAMFAMALLLLLYGDIIDAVRHRWPAALTAVTVLWATSRLTNTLLPDSLNEAWTQNIASAAGITLGLAVSATITHLPQHQPHQPTEGSD